MERPRANPGADAMKAKADAYAAKVMPIIEAMRGKGITSNTQIARELTRRRVQTARGGKWTKGAVRELLARAVGLSG